RVLQREILVPTRLLPEVRHLALDPHFGECRLDHTAHRLRHLAHAEDARLLRGGLWVSEKIDVACGHRAETKRCRASSTDLKSVQPATRPGRCCAGGNRSALHPAQPTGQVANLPAAQIANLCYAAAPPCCRYARARSVIG